MPASLICQHKDKTVLKSAATWRKKMFIISVLAQGKIKEVILPNAGQTAVKTSR
jgi:hypothetical protein